MLRAISAIVVAVSIHLLASRCEASLDVPLIWNAHLGGRSVDIYATNPSSTQLYAVGTTMIQMSIAAYATSSADRAAKSAIAHYQPTSYVDTGPNTQVLFAQDSRALVIAVRGSQEPQDWLVDGSDLLFPGEIERVHVGFLRSANSIFNEARNRAVNARSAGKQVWITGHSLGGAVAQLLAYKLHKAGVTVDGVHTFGSPAVGTSNWAMRYNDALRSKTHRWVNEVDPIVCYPLQQENWQHAGKANVIAESGSIALDSAMMTCVSAFPLLPVVCEPQTRWGKALAWLTLAATFCYTVPETGLFDLVANLIGSDFGQHDKDNYKALVSAQLSDVVRRGVLLD